ncbi:hypothetical protein D3C79_1120590 [compost metagenome]
MLGQQPFKGLQHAPGGGIQGLDQRLAGLGLASAAQQQRNLLRQRHCAEHLPTGLLAIFE